MTRYNIFNEVHKGLRAALYQTAIELQRTDFTNADEGEEMMNRIREVILLFREHAKTEEKFILPAISDYEPAITVSFTDEHAEGTKRVIQVKTCIAAVEHAGTQDEREVSVRNLETSFNAFIAFILRHMAKEEEVINDILWRYYSDYELQVINNTIEKSMDPWIRDFYSTWQIRGLNNREAAAWMNHVREQMPEVAFRTLLQKAEYEWPVERFRKVVYRLNEYVLN